jgi:uncharacterized DUF497 family protein
MIYEWDEAKRRANLAKHGLDFLDAARVIESPYVRVQDTLRRGEARKLATAYVFEVLAVLSVVYVAGQRCRIVSFRPANRSERRSYHEWLENDRDER